MRAAPAVLIAAALVACVDRRTIDLPIDAYAFEYGFMVLINDAGLATRSSPPFGIADGRVTFGALPAFQLEADESGLMLIGLPPNAVQQTAKFFDEQRAAELGLLLNEPTELPFFDQETLTLATTLPAETQVVRGELDGDLQEIAIPDELALRIPIAPEGCTRAAPMGLEPYGVQPDIIEGRREDSQENFFFIDQLDERALIAMTPRFLHLFRAGEPYVASPVTWGAAGNQLGREVTPRKPLLGGYALDRDTGTVWLGAGIDAEQPENGSDGLLFELSVDPSGIRIVRTATLAGEPFAAVDLDADRRPVLISFRGRVVRFEDGFVDLPPITTIAPDEIALRIHATGDAKHPYLASSTGQVHLLDADTQSWTTFRVPVAWLRSFPPEDHYNAGGLASWRRSDGSLELWAAGTSSTLIHKIADGPWMPYSLFFPPSFVGCASEGDYPNLADASGFDSIEIDGPDLFISLRECTALLQVRPSEDCTAVISVAGEPPSYTPSDLQAVHVLGGQLVLAGEDGLLYRGALR